jgi:hypothetical protein
LIKFRCEHCGQKLGVPAKYAGKTVRCTGCKEGAVVPQPEPEVEPVVDEGLESYDVHEPAAESGSPFDDLDLLGGEPDGLRELAPVAAGAAAAGNSCPNCGAQVGPQAVICVQCGHNLKAGGKVKTKVSKERGGGGGVGISGRTIVAWLVGGVVTGVCVVVWLLVAAFLGRQMNILAWGTGALTGLTVAVVHQRRSLAGGIGAAVLALGGIAAVKGLFLLLMVGASMIPDAVGTFGEAMGEAMSEAIMEDPEAFENTYRNHMLDEGLFDPELQARIESAPQPENEFQFELVFDEALTAEIDEVVKADIAEMTQEDKQAFADSYFAFDEQIEEDSELQDDMDELRNMNPWAEAFSFFDILWIPLGLVSAFTAGQGKD